MSFHAVFDRRTASLSSEFGESIAMKWTGLSREALAELVGGEISRGSRKGALRGDVLWLKCVRGGWVSSRDEGLDGRAGGFVCNKAGATVAKLLLNADGEIVWSAAEASAYSLKLDRGLKYAERKEKPEPVRGQSYDERFAEAMEDMTGQDLDALVGM